MPENWDYYRDCDYQDDHYLVCDYHHDHDYENHNFPCLTRITIVIKMIRIIFKSEDDRVTLVAPIERRTRMYGGT